MDARADCLFEVSWEVCNKVGGIYTVVKSKAALMKEYYRDNYFVVGPYFPAKAIGEFKETVPPDFIRQVFEKLNQEGISCHYGTWLVEGEPLALLVDFSAFICKKDFIKRWLWDNYQIDSLNTEYFSFDEPVIWAYAVGRLIEELALSINKKVVAHFHEWLSGAALLYLKKTSAKVATVFTTHATMLGRSMTGAGINLYSVMNKINPEEEAYKLGVQAKHQTEYNCAKSADVFTTVSEITGIEASSLLGRKPDVLLLNGLDLRKFPTFEEASIRHNLLKSKIKEFIMYYFFPYYAFDLDNTLIYFIAGRYEFHDKGVDIFIKALSKLNEKLKSEKSSKTVVAFFWIPGNIRAIKPELLANKTFFEDIKDSIDDSSTTIKEKLTCSLITQNPCSEEILLGKDLLFELKSKIMRFVRKGSPSPSTHDLYDEDKDIILNSFKENNLLNSEEDRIKVVYYPIYLTGADRLLDLAYYESMQGSHLGVFPSFYEPWGYTPLEAAGLGVSSVTTDLAGFGRFIRKSSKKGNVQGVFVIPRLNRDDETVTADLADVMYNFAMLSKEDRIKNKMEAKRLSGKADWRVFAENYITAHNLAVGKKWS